MTEIRIATRASQLALVQARWVAAALERATPGTTTSLVEITTSGDTDRTSPVAMLTEVGAFVRAVQHAVLDGRADIAVHSCKDLPVAGPDELDVVYPQRESPWDVLVGTTLGELPPGARVGTGSPRRSAQLKLLRPDLAVDEIRGNVDTRIAKVTSGEYQAIVLAEAGLNRLHRTDVMSQRLRLDQMVPAPAQGALAVEARRDGPAWELLTGIDDSTARRSVETERLLLERTGAGCRSALGAHAQIQGDTIIATAFVEDDQGPRRASVWAKDPASSVEALMPLLGL